jgi:hypothetical protein
MLVPWPPRPIATAQMIVNPPPWMQFLCFSRARDSAARICVGGAGARPTPERRRPNDRRRMREAREDRAEPVGELRRHPSPCTPTRRRPGGCSPPLAALPAATRSWCQRSLPARSLPSAIFRETLKVARRISIARSRSCRTTASTTERMKHTSSSATRVASNVAMGSFLSRGPTEATLPRRGAAEGGPPRKESSATTGRASDQRARARARSRARSRARTRPRSRPRAPAPARSRARARARPPRHGYELPPPARALPFLARDYGFPGRCVSVAAPGTIQGAFQPTSAPFREVMPR